MFNFVRQLELFQELSVLITLISSSFLKRIIEGLCWYLCAHDWPCMSNGQTVDNFRVNHLPYRPRNAAPVLLACKSCKSGI